jgi:toxin ParE1/3/4
MLPVYWTARARLNVAEIVDYVAGNNPVAANALEHRIISAVARLPLNPTLYRTGRIAGTRELVVDRNHVVIYRVTASAIQVVTVLHSRTKYP